MPRHIKFMPHLGTLLITCWALHAPAQSYEAAFPRPGATKAAEGERFVVWKVSYPSGKSTGMRKLELDQVSVFLKEGAVKFTRPDGSSTIEEEKVGSVRFDPKGTSIEEEGVSDQPSEATIFQITDAVLEPWPITPGIPGQEPRAGGIKLFENQRISVWDQSWKPDTPAVPHLHYLRAAGVYLEGGTLRAVTKDGVETLYRRQAGEVNIIKAPIPAPHTEYLFEGTPRILFIEVKNQ